MSTKKVKKIKTPVAEEAPVMEQAPVMEEAPVVEEAPVEDAPPAEPVEKSKSKRGKKKTLAEMDAFDLFVQDREKSAKKDWQGLSEERKQHYEDLLDKRKKRPKSDYQVFLAARSVELAKTHPHLNFAERSKLCAGEWREKKAAPAVEV